MRAIIASPRQQQLAKTSGVEHHRRPALNEQLWAGIWPTALPNGQRALANGGVRRADPAL
jgi:hypothetical protein